MLFLFSFLSAVLAVPVEHSVSHVSGQTLSGDLGKRQSLSDTENQLGLCRPITVSFATGTLEVGNVGELTGPPFFIALDALLCDDNVGVQGVDYPATIEGYLEGGDPGGAATLASLTEQAAPQCPDTQIVLSGYRYKYSPKRPERNTKFFSAKDVNWCILAQRRYRTQWPRELLQW